MGKYAHKQRSLSWLWILCAVLALATAGLLTWFFGYEKVFQEAWNTMPPGGKLTLVEEVDATLLLQWPQGAGADYYTVDIWQGPVPEDPEAVSWWHTQTEELQCLISLPDTRDITIQVRSFARYETLTSQEARPGERDLQVRGSFASPQIQDLQWTADPDADTVTLEFSLEPYEVCQLGIQLTGSDHSWDMTLEQGHVQLQFGPEARFPIPEHGQEYAFFLRSYTDDGKLLHRGLESYGFSLDREAFLGTTLLLDTQELGHNRYSFTWNETKGQGYQLQHLNPETQQWDTLYQTDQVGQRSYTTGPLARYQDHSFRVVALQTEAVAPAEATVTTGPSLIYSTVWPLMDLTAYTDPNQTGALGTAPKGKALCVLDEQQGFFLVRLEDAQGWIDSRFCMINLPEFLGDLCRYDITNSYSSIFLVHGYEIPGITGTVVTGYEHVAQNKTYLVPLLYPTALKLEKAAQAALYQGYRLKIYDSYRPGNASDAVRKATQSILETPLPETTYRNIVISDLPQVTEGETLTYDQLMTGGGQYSIGYFIAGYGSRHNYGAALDLTLERVRDKEELPMQCAIHDLSHYAVLRKNNSNAELLQKIMVSAGFGTLVSEWWHFQDNEILDSLDLQPLRQGLSPEGWVADGTGWRYRRSSGSFCKDTTRTIGGTEYTFDTKGYVIEN